MHARAQWAAIRTFHRKVKLVGETATGQPVFAIGPVQLTLPAGAQHFHPVAACSRCGEIVEFLEPVLSAADLEFSGEPHLCQKCARMGGHAPGRVPPGGEAVPSSGVETDAAWATAPSDDDPSSESAPGADGPRFVPAVRDTGDVEPLVPAGADVFWGVSGQTTRAGDGNGSGDGFDRIGEYVTVVLRSAKLQADEIRVDAERAAAKLLEDAEEHAAQQQAAAAQAQEAADNDRAQIAALRAELEGTVARQQQQVAGLVSDAETRAAAIREAAEADAIRIRESAADAAITSEAERIAARAVARTDDGPPPPEPEAQV